MDNGLKVEGVTAGYKHFSIHNISFELRPGDILGLVGKSGAGKSTVIKTLLGILRTQTGSISVVYKGKKQPLRTVVGYSAQDHSLFDFLTIQENIELFAEMQGTSTRDVKKRMDDLLKRFDLYNHKHKQIRSLSGGMRKRADLAVSLIHDPQIIILDEPFAGLDISIQEFIWEMIKTLADEGKIIIISSHLLENLERHCDKWAMVHNRYFYENARLLEEKEVHGSESMCEYLTEVFSQ